LCGIRRFIPKSEHPYFLRFTLTFTGIVVSWAVVHDLYLIQVEARHFTEFHRQILPIQNHALLAIQYAILATFGPGLVFGFLAYFVARGGGKRKVGIKGVAVGFVILILLLEVLLLSLGHYTRAQFLLDQSTLYPAEYYPERSAGIVFTQTVNISAYLFVPALGALYLLIVYLRRR
jgi:hypothetical protein